MIMWAGATQSTSNLAQGMNSSKSNKNLRQTSVTRCNEVKDNKRLQSIKKNSQTRERSNSRMDKSPSVIHGDKENLIQSQYLKQLFKMQQKYQNVKKGHPQRNQHSQNGIQSYRIQSAQFNGGVLHDKSETLKSLQNLANISSSHNLNATQKIPKNLHKVTQSFSKQLSSQNLSINLGKTKSTEQKAQTHNSSILGHQKSVSHIPSQYKQPETSHQIIYSKKPNFFCSNNS